MRTARVLTGVIAGVVAMSGVVLAVSRMLDGAGPVSESPTSLRDVIGEDFTQVAPRDAVRPVYEPTFVLADEVGLSPGELVIGVEVGGLARAYPVGFLNHREMVNDRMGDVPVLVTWCPLCHTGLVFDRRVDGEELVFGNQGALYRNAQTWWDHRTESVWSQVFGEALHGPLKGTRLGQIPAAVETWGAWQRAHPNTLVLEIPEGFVGEVPTTEFVIGIRIGDDVAAFAFRFVAERGVVNDDVGGVPLAVYAGDDRVVRVYARTVGGAVVDLEAEGGRLIDRRTGTAWDPVSGQAIAGPLVGHPLPPLPWTSSYDWAWRDFYPDTRIVG